SIVEGNNGFNNDTCALITLTMGASLALSTHININIKFSIFASFSVKDG
ncbi:5145_t:CDS:1, partial [Dentiscutata heterogama]